MPPLFAIPFPAIDPIALEIGPVVIRWYALAYVAGFLLGWQWCMALARRFPDYRPTAQDMDEFLVWAIVGTILGGRIGYVLFYNASSYLDNPLAALAVWQGGMSFHGGLIGVTLAMLLFAKRRGFSPFALGDLTAAGVTIGLFFGRLANFVNQELYGRVTDVPWGVIFQTAGPEPRHPSQLYEAVLEGIVLFAVLAVMGRRADVRRRPGLMAGVFLIGYGAFRFLVEFFRQPDPQLGFLWLGATMGQLLCIPMIALGVWMARRALVRPPLGTTIAGGSAGSK